MNGGQHSPRGEARSTTLSPVVKRVNLLIHTIIQLYATTRGSALRFLTTFATKAQGYSSYKNKTKILLRSIQVVSRTAVNAVEAVYSGQQQFFFSIDIIISQRRLFVKKSLLTRITSTTAQRTAQRQTGNNHILANP